MVALVPVLLMLLTVAALAGVNRLQPDFRSHWIVALGGALLTILSLVVILFSLPANTAFLWFAFSPDLQFSLNFSVSTFSWPPGLAVMVLFVGGLAVQMRRPPAPDWRAWAPGVLFTAVALFAVFSADLFTLAVSLFLLDCFSFVLQRSANQEEATSRLAAFRFGINLFAVIVILAAHALADSWPWLSQNLILPAVAVRLGLFTPRLFHLAFDGIRKEIDLLLQFCGPISAIVLFGLWEPIQNLPIVFTLATQVFLGLLIFLLYAPARLLPRFVCKLRLPARPSSVSPISAAARGLRWSFNLLAQTLEGEAGILWAMLFIALFLSLAVQFGLGGL